MLALETLARRVHDDRPQAKYARNPPYGEDVKWLLRVAKKLGEFCHETCRSCCGIISSTSAVEETGHIYHHTKINKLCIHRCNNPISDAVATVTYPM
jgi:hypothetical protein